MGFKITSSAFIHEGEIPKIYTCQGDDISPELNWQDAPEGTQSFALIVDDPDAPDPEAPKMIWVHWILYNIPANCLSLSENIQNLPTNTLDGTNDWQRIGYGGPCPPIGRHRYYHKLYALDTVLPDLNQPTKDQLLEAMDGHILAETVLMGTYKKT